MEQAQFAQMHTDGVIQYIFNHQATPAWLWDHVLFLTRHGSHAYGMATPTSDLDVKGVTALPRSFLHGTLSRYEQLELKGDPDVVVFALWKLLKLAADTNPNVIEILFTDESDVLYMRPEFEEVLANRHLFLTKKARHTFGGYALSQLRRIRLHRHWILSPRKSPPSREEFGLPEKRLIPDDQRSIAEAIIQRQLDTWDIDVTALDEASKIEFKLQVTKVLADLKVTAESQFDIAGRMLGFTDNYMEVLAAERRYSAACDEWKQYQTWQRQRNPARYAMELESGYDRKHAAHLVRLLRCAVEILRDGVVRVRRPDAEELLAIRNGAWTYEEVEAYAEETLVLLGELAKTSKLPDKANLNAVNALCLSVTEKML